MASSQDRDEDRWERATVPVAVASGSTVASRGDTELAATDASATPGTSPFVAPSGDRFTERAELGRGGMGRVVEAVDNMLGRPVAIKQSLADTVTMAARFEREVRITAGLQHPGIVPVLDAGLDAEGRPYYVMRKIDGKPLADLVANRSVVERLALVPNVLAAADAVAYAHARGVIHRDIKPWNVLVGGFGETLVIDWGLARTLDASDEPISPPSSGSDGLTRLGSAMGTPGFMAPEQARGESIDRRADVFALGATLYYVLAGSLPFGSDPTVALELAIADHQLDVTRIPEEVPTELVAIVTKATAARRDARYANANELAIDLRRFLTGQLVAAHRYTFGQLARRWIRRHRIAVAIATIAVIVLAVVATIAIRSVIAERDRADAARVAEKTRADELLVERADSIAAEDPTRAVALIKQLAPDSTLWDRAIPVLRTARSRGVASGRLAHPGAAQTPRAQVIADGNDVVTMVFGSNELLRHDAALRAPPRHLVELEHSPREIRWIDRESIAVLDAQAQLFRVGLDGTSKQLDAGGPVQTILASDDGRVRVIAVRSGLATAALREVDPRGGPAREIALVRDALRIDNALLYSTHTAAIYRPDDGPEITLLQDMGKVAYSFAANAAGTRFVVSTYDLVVEWEVRLSGLVERGRWTFSAAFCEYAGDSLVAGSDDVFRLVPGQEPRSILRARLQTYARSAREVFVATEDGAVWRISEDTVERVGGKTDRLVSLAATGDRLVGMTRSGLVLSWQLAAVRPSIVRVPRMGFAPHLSVAGLWWNENTKSYRIERGSEQSIAFESLKPSCYGPAFEMLIGDGPELRFVHFDVTTQKRTPISNDYIAIICSLPETSRIGLVTRDHRIDVMEGSAPDRPIASIALDFKPTSAALEGRWLLVADATGTIERIDLASTVRVRTRVGTSTPDDLVVMADGRAAIMHGTTLRRWDGTTVTGGVSIPDVPVLAANPAGLVGVTSDHSIIVIDEADRVTTFHGGPEFPPAIATSAPFATMPALGGGVELVDLRTGARWQIPGAARGASVDPSGTVVAIIPEGPGVLLWQVLAAAEMRAWLEDATNATIVRGSTRVVFP